MSRRRSISFAGASVTGRTGIDHRPGTVLAGCTIVRKAAADGRLTRFLVTATCAHERMITGVDLRKADRDGRNLVCDACRPASRTRGNTARSGQALTKQETNARTAARRKDVAPGNYGRGSRICKRCSSLPHRVIASDGPNCQRCGLAYAPLPPVKADGEARKAFP